MTHQRDNKNKRPNNKMKKRQRSLSDPPVHVKDTKDNLYNNYLQNKSIREIARRGIDNRVNLELPDMIPIRRMIVNGRIIEIKQDDMKDYICDKYNKSLRKRYKQLADKWEKDEVKEEKKEKSKDKGPDIFIGNRFDNKYKLNTHGRKRHSSLKFDPESSGAKKQFGDETGKEKIGGQTIWYTSYPSGEIEENGIIRTLELALGSTGNNDWGIGKKIGKKIGVSSNNKVDVPKKVTKITENVNKIRAGWTDNKRLVYSLKAEGKTYPIHVSYDLTSITYLANNVMEINIRIRIPFKDNKKMEIFYEMEYWLNK